MSSLLQIPGFIPVWLCHRKGREKPRRWQQWLEGKASQSSWERVGQPQGIPARKSGFTLAKNNVHQGFWAGLGLASLRAGCLSWEWEQSGRCWVGKHYREKQDFICMALQVEQIIKTWDRLTFCLLASETAKEYLIFSLFKGLGLVVSEHSLHSHRPKT